MPHQFYTIIPNQDGTVDIYLDTIISNDPQNHRPIQVHVVKGIIPWQGLEESIRQNYYSWHQIAQTVNLQESEDKP